MAGGPFGGMVRGVTGGIEALRGDPTAPDEAAGEDDADPLLLPAPEGPEAPPRPRGRFDMDAPPPREALPSPDGAGIAALETALERAQAAAQAATTPDERSVAVERVRHLHRELETARSSGSAPPAGPLGRAAAAGPARALPAIEPGERVAIEDEAFEQPVSGVMVAETPDGPLIRADDGEELVIPRADLAAGLTRVRPESPVEANARVMLGVTEGSAEARSQTPVEAAPMATVSGQIPGLDRVSGPVEARVTPVGEAPARHTEAPERPDAVPVPQPAAMTAATPETAVEAAPEPAAPTEPVAGSPPATEPQPDSDPPPGPAFAVLVRTGGGRQQEVTHPDRLHAALYAYWQALERSRRGSREHLGRRAHALFQDWLPWVDREPDVPLARVRSGPRRWGGAAPMRTPGEINDLAQDYAELVQQTADAAEAEGEASAEAPILIDTDGLAEYWRRRAERVEADQVPIVAAPQGAITRRDGSPFPSVATARRAAHNRGLAVGGHRPIAWGEGVVLVPVDPARPAAPAEPTPPTPVPPAERPSDAAGSTRTAEPPPGRWQPEDLGPPARPRDRGLGRSVPRSDRELDRLLERGEDRRSRPTLSPEQKEAATRARDETARRFEAAAADTEGRADVQAMDPYRASVERARDRAVAAIAAESRRASDSAPYRDRLARRWTQGFETTEANVSLPRGWTGPERRAHAKGRAWRQANPPPTEDARVRVEAVTARGRRTRFDLPADPKVIREVGDRRARQDLTTFYAVRGGERETGPFGPIHRQYRHDAQGAIARLTADRTGEAVAALRHPQVGDIDLVWGEAPSATREGYGLAKIVAKHPEVLPDLQGFLNTLTVDAARSGNNRLRLSSDDGAAVVRLDWDDASKHWLMTAFRYDADSGATPDTTAFSPADDTASRRAGALPNVSVRSLDGNDSADSGARTDTTAFSPADDTASRRAGTDETVSLPSLDGNAGAGSGATIDTAAVAPADDTASRETDAPSLAEGDADGNTTAIRSPDKPAAIRGRPLEREQVVRQLKARLRELGLDQSLSLAFPPQLFGEPTDGGPPIVLDGEYVAEARLIKIAMDAADPLSILDHEAVHGLRDLGLFDDREWAILVRAAKARPGLWESVERDYRPHGYTESQLEEEVVARLVEWRSRQRRAHPQSGVERLLQRIGDFFRALANWARDLGLQSPEGVLGRMDRGEIGARAPQGEAARSAAPAGPPSRASRTPRGPRVVEVNRTDVSTARSDARWRSDAIKAIRAHIGKAVRHGEFTRPIQISRQGVRHTISDAGDELLALATKLPDAIRTAQRIAQPELPKDPDGRDRGVKRVHRLQGRATIDGEGHITQIVIKEYNDGALFYDLSLMRKGSPSVAVAFRLRGDGARWNSYAEAAQDEVQPNPAEIKGDNVREQGDGASSEDPNAARRGGPPDSVAFRLRGDGARRNSSGEAPGQNIAPDGPIRNGSKVSGAGADRGRRPIPDERSGGMVPGHPYGVTPEAQAATAGRSVEGSPSLYAVRGPFDHTAAPGPRKVTRWLRDTLSQASTQHLHRLLPAIPMRPLLDEVAKGMPSARRYLHAKERMDALRNHWHAKTAEVVQDWAAIRGASKADNDALMRLMHDSTLAQVDPSRAPNKTIRKGNQEDRRNYARLRRRWERLSPEARAMYARVRDTYGEMADAMEAAIVANLRGAGNAAMRKAQADLEAERQRITRADMTADARAEATAKAERLYAGRKRRAELQTSGRIHRLRQAFEANRLKGPYFPLARFGDFIVTARDKKTGEVVSFSRFESVKQRDAHAAELRREGYAVKAGKLVEGESLKSLVDPRLVADITGVLEKGDVDPAIQDQVWQMYLQTLPDRSLRTRRIHRKGRAGYDQDAMRAFSSHLFHGAHQLARLRYALPLSEHLRAMETEADATGSPDNAVTIVNELTKRHAYLMNPQGSEWAHRATSAAFVWFLGASPAAATVNLTQTVVMGVPILAAYDGRGSRSVGRAIKELNRALVDFTAGKGHAAASSRLTAEEKAALSQAYETGVIDRTQAYDLAGVAESGVEYRHHWHTWMSRIGWLFHHAERLNREVTYLAAYRMAKAKGESAAGAGRRAADLTWKTHFDYQNTSRPSLMYNDWMKVFLTFRNFQINMLYRLFRDSHTLLSSADKTERREAMMQLGGTTGMMMAMAGITGTWGFGIAKAIASLFFPEEEDVEQQLKRGMQAHLPGWMVGMLLDGVPGYLSRTALSERIGMPNLWFRPPLGQPEGVEFYQHYVNELLGPAFAIPSNVMMGLHRIQEGHVWRGVETAVPKFVRDPMRAWRFAREGALTYRGDALVERFDPAELLIQALGFTPAALTERYGTNGALRRFERVVTDRRSRLMGEYDQALQREDRGRQRRVLTEIQAFNAAYPMHPITGDSLRRSIRSRQRTSAQTDGGVRINPRLLGAARETVAAPLY